MLASERLCMIEGQQRGQESEFDGVEEGPRKTEEELRNVTGVA